MCGHMHFIGLDKGTPISMVIHIVMMNENSQLDAGDLLYLHTLGQMGGV